VINDLQTSSGRAEPAEQRIQEIDGRRERGRLRSCPRPTGETRKVLQDTDNMIRRAETTFAS
jgi:hypothetical protein